MAHTLIRAARLIDGNGGPPLDRNHGPVRSEDPSVDGQRWEAGLHRSYLKVSEMAGQSAATWFRSIDTPDEDHPNLSAERSLGRAPSATA